jgi:hypothetical protein
MWLLVHKIASTAFIWWWVLSIAVKVALYEFLVMETFHGTYYHVLAALRLRKELEVNKTYLLYVRWWRQSSVPAGRRTSVAEPVAIRFFD